MNDLINGGLELFGALLLVNNCRLLHLHKKVQGVSVMTTAFFTLWGLWNLYFYPANRLWLSFGGGLCLASVNIVWVSLAAYYSRGAEKIEERQRCHAGSVQVLAETPRKE